MIHQYKVELQERIKKIKRKRITDLSRENNKNSIENNFLKKKSKNKKNIVTNTKLSKSCYVIK